MSADRTSPDGAAAAVPELDLDFSGLLGADQAFSTAGDAKKQAELIDAYCNKIGSEGCCC